MDVVGVPCMSLCVCVSVIERERGREGDSSSEAGDEWASSLGAAEAIFSIGLYNGTGGGTTEDLREHITNLSVFCRSASERTWTCRIRFVREGV